ncbi:MAG: transcription termination/antitermination NusG family protein [Nitrospirota bacterium]
MWYAIYTKPGKEDAVALQLQGIGIEVLNPRLKLKKYRRNKLVEVIGPLFPCYLFANFEKEKYAHLITYTRGVRYIVGKNMPIVVHDEIINTIKEGTEVNGIIVIKPQRYHKGDRVVIREGPFKDFYGIFEREIKGQERVLILLEAIHYKLELEAGYLIKA